jgi:hypothetical protein
MERQDRFVALTAALVSLVVFPGWECGQPVLEDPSFDLWCGKTLCAWQVDAGSVRRVATWHRSDFGVELMGDPVQISQLSKITSSDTTCLLFELQADRDDSVRLQIQMDFLDDGIIDYSHDLVTDDWRQAEYRVGTPKWFDGVRFIVRKTGAGEAVLAHIRVTRSSDCPAPGVELRDLRDGTRCETASECKGGYCEEIPKVSSWAIFKPSAICSGCGEDADCGAGDVCGLESSPSAGEPHKSCGPPGRHRLGERCLGDAECKTGVCCGDVCSECCHDHGPSCPGGASCASAAWWDLGPEYQSHLLPAQCSPGESLGAAGAPCLQDADCQSGSCLGSGELKTCQTDGRRCDTDDDCPMSRLCRSIGAYGGTCQ